MVDGNGKVSGEGSLFVLLLNEEPSDDHSGLDGKARLHQAWHYQGTDDEMLSVACFSGTTTYAAAFLRQ